MPGLIRWFAHNSVAANMLMLCILLLGVLVLPFSHKEILPTYIQHEVLISSQLPGASPQQVADTLCRPLEQALQSIPALGMLSSVAEAHSCQITVEISSASERSRVLAQIEQRLAQVPLPAGASEPVVIQPQQPIMISRLMVTGPLSHQQLRELAVQVHDELQALGLKQVRLRDVAPQQWRITLPQSQLQRYQISLQEVAELLRQQPSLNVGQLHDGAQTSALVVEKTENTTDLQALTVRAYADGGRVRLGDIAGIDRIFGATELSSRLDGLPAVSVSVYQQADLGILQIAERVERYLAARQATLPDGVRLTLVQDNSRFFSQRITLLRDNAIAGLLLVFFALLAVLRLRLAFWVTMGIPVAFCGAFVCLYLTGTSINVISTFGLLIVLGMVVDDAIIVGENIYRHQRQKPGVKGAVAGTLEFMWPVTAAALTTMICFAPLLFLPGGEGELLAQIPVVVIATLGFSLLECLLILPAHLASQPETSRPTIGLAERFEAWVQRWYRPLLQFTLRWRYSAVSLFVAVLALTLAMLVTGWWRVDLSPPIDAEVATGHVAFAQGGRVQQTLAAVARMEQAALALKVELQQETGSEQILHVRTLVGGDHYGDVFLTLASGRERPLSGDAIMQRWRQKIGTIDDVAELNLSARYQQYQPAGFSISLHSDNARQLQQAAQAVRLRLQNYSGVLQTFTSFSRALGEVQVVMQPQADNLQLQMPQLALQIRQAYAGIQVQHQQDGETVNLLLTLPENERASLWHLQNLPIRLADGSLVPLQAVAEIRLGSSPAQVLRQNGQQVAFVRASVDFSQVDAAALARRLQQDFTDTVQPSVPAVHWGQVQSLRYQDQLKQQLLAGFAVAMLVMLVLMAMLLASYFQPLMILSAVPFGLVGALLGHALLLQPLTLWSMAGMIAVSGVVVNDNMVLVFYINEKIRDGQRLQQAIVDAGVVRFRPIMLTTITTFFGLLPMLLENSWEAQFLIPMAISISFGVLFATLISLLLVPALYMISADIKRLLA